MCVKGLLCAAACPQAPPCRRGGPAPQLAAGPGGGAALGLQRGGGRPGGVRQQVGVQLCERGSAAGTVRHAARILVQGLGGPSFTLPVRPRPLSLPSVACGRKTRHAPSAPSSPHPVRGPSPPLPRYRSAWPTSVQAMKVGSSRARAGGGAVPLTCPHLHMLMWSSLIRLPVFPARFLPRRATTSRSTRSPSARAPPLPRRWRCRCRCPPSSGRSCRWASRGRVRNAKSMHGREHGAVLPALRASSHL